MTNLGMQELAWVYILRCADGTLYTGWTSNLPRRMSTHQAGKASKYTRARLPVTLVYKESFLQRTLAMKREYEIKQLPKQGKEQLINGCD